MDSSPIGRPRFGRVARLIAVSAVLLGLSGCCCCVIPVAEETGRTLVAEGRLPERSELSASLSAGR